MDPSRTRPRWLPCPVTWFLSCNQLVMNMDTDLEPPPAWECLQDRVSAFLESHPDFDLDDAIEALIWGEGDSEDD